jgi:23S rRNA pseudouridine955/2504/2580 synthase
MTSTPARTGPGAATLTIEPDQAGRRLDNFLVAQLKGVPRSHVYRLLRRGEVRVNSRRSKADYRLQRGDRVRIPPVRQRGESGPATPPTQLSERLAARIVYEDDRLLVLNKPAGMAVHGGSGVGFGLIETLRALRPGAPFLELVHRLDRETSGLLMVAKRRSTLRALHELLRSGGVTKRYLALLCGAWSGETQRVEASLEKFVLRGGERQVRVHPEGKPAASVFAPVQVYTSTTLMDIELDTGRTHQIRVHAAHLGHPVAGDTKYGDSACNKALARTGLRRLFLHAHALAVTLPDGRELDLSIPLDAELRRVLDALT